jgi:hypothetical protein
MSPGIAVKDRKKAAALARQCNDFAKKMSVEHSGRFDAFAALPMPDVDASLAEIHGASEAFVLRRGAFGDSIDRTSVVEFRWKLTGRFRERLSVCASASLGRL